MSKGAAIPVLGLIISIAAVWLKNYMVGPQEDMGVDGSIIDLLFNASAHGNIFSVPETRVGTLLKTFIENMPTAYKTPITQRAQEMLAVSQGNTSNAIEMYRARQKDTAAKLVNMGLSMVPLVGSASNTFRDLWGQVRQAGFVAAVYGHNVDDAEIKAKMLEAIYTAEYGSAPKYTAKKAIKVGARRGTKEMMNKLAQQLITVQGAGGSLGRSLFKRGFRFILDHTILLPFTIISALFFSTPCTNTLDVAKEIFTQPEILLKSTSEKGTSLLHRVFR